MFQFQAWCFYCKKTTLQEDDDGDRYRGIHKTGETSKLKVVTTCLNCKKIVRARDDYGKTHLTDV